MKRVRSTRFRLTVWYSVTLAAGLVLLAIATWALMRYSLMSDLNHSLRDQAYKIGLFVNSESNDPTANLAEELAEYARGLPDDTYIAVADVSGKVIYTSLPSFPWPTAAAPASRRPMIWNQANYRVLVDTFSVARQRWHVVIVASLNPINLILNRLRLLLIALVPLIAAIAMFGGTWLSRRALKPVDEITAAARSLGIANLSERLPVPNSNDELQRLSEAWNNMLSRLEDAVQRLSQFTSDASHELRTPLAVVRTTAELTLRRSRSDEDYRSALLQILSESERMTHLVDDLLFLARCDSKSQDVPMMNVDLVPLVDTLCSQLAPLAEQRGLSLQTQLDMSYAWIWGNELALRRLVLSLLDNALKYSNSGGVIRISLAQRAAHALLQVQDEGCGIHTAELPFIFDRFYRTPKAREGTVNGYGLGLSLANSIAQRHNAQIEVESIPRAGSTFRVALLLSTPIEKPEQQ